MVLADSHRISHVPRYSGYHWIKFTCNTRLSLAMVELSNSFLQMHPLRLWSYNPSLAETRLVWAFSRSLAATRKITIVFSSSGYLDVSVHQVCPLAGLRSSIGGVAPFGNLTVYEYLLLR